MKAITYTEYGPPDVLVLKEVDKPVCGDDEVLIKIKATTATAGDCEIRRPDIPNLIWFFVRLYMGFRTPRKQVLGQELAGEIEAVGKNVETFKKGDQVFATTGIHFGAYADYICLPADGAIALKPANMSFAEAAAVPVSGNNALHFLRRAKIKPGEKVLIHAASGSIGTYAVQIAKYYGAEVTAVCGPTSLALITALGADKVIDYTTEDFTENGEKYDVIFDTIGRTAYGPSLQSLNKKGRYLLANPGLGQMFRSLWTSLTRDKTVMVAFAPDGSDHLAFLRELCEAGQLTTVIDSEYPLAQMAEAHRYVERRQKTGNLIITVA
ncbi:MAG: NAD(P)-dependent alcohol dehydrogenase [Alphaproteobacteria bacterium]|nr:MAG: NAD(P)-dependent alcohol dehydrogenase [Alphaproteobacteria bacterium]